MAQGDLASVKTYRDRPLTLPQTLRDFCNWKILDIPVEERTARCRWEHGHGSIQEAGKLIAFKLHLEVEVIRHDTLQRVHGWAVSSQGQNRATPTPPGLPSQTHVPSDGRQPPVITRRIVQLISAAPRFDQGLLGQVLGRLCAARQTRAEPEQPIVFGG